MERFQHPLLLLQALDEQFRQNIQSSPEPKDTQQTWAGLGITIKTQRLAISSNEIIELFRLLESSRIARVPGAKFWFTGLISHHGQLLPLVNLHAYLLEEPTEIAPNARVIVIGQEQQKVGLLCNTLAGLRQFTRAEQVNEGPAFAGKIGEYLAAVFRQDEHYWGVLSTVKLARDPEFANAVRA